jgi:integrase
MWRDQTGKLHKKTFAKRKLADSFLTTVRSEVEDGTFRRIEPLPMRKVFTRWLKHLDTRVKLGEVKASTAGTYRCNVRKHFVPTLGDYRSDRLTPEVMAEWRAGLADQIEAGEMAAKTFNNLFNLLHSILEWARHPARGYLKHDPLVGQKRLTVRRSEADYLEDAEIAALLDAASDDAEASAIVHVALFGGLRRGEVFGLQWGDVEANGDTGGRLRVRRSVYGGKVTTPKTANSERAVDVPPSVLAALDRHREGTAPMGDGYVFRTSTGQPIDPGTWYSRVFKRLRQRAGLRESIGMHACRHTYASLLIRQGENPKYVSRQLGHASTSFTMDVYGHLFEATSTAAMGRLDTAIRAAKRQRFEVIEGGTG